MSSQRNGKLSGKTRELGEQDTGGEVSVQKSQGRSRGRSRRCGMRVDFVLQKASREPLTGTAKTSGTDTFVQNRLLQLLQEGAVTVQMRSIDSE